MNLLKRQRKGAEEEEKREETGSFRSKNLLADLVSKAWVPGHDAI